MCCDQAGSSRLVSETLSHIKQPLVAQSAPWQQPTERMTGDIIEVGIFQLSRVASVNILLIQPVKVEVKSAVLKLCPSFISFYSCMLDRFGVIWNGFR